MKSVLSREANLRSSHVEVSSLETVYDHPVLSNLAAIMSAIDFRISHVYFKEREEKIFV